MHEDVINDIKGLPRSPQGANSTNDDVINELNRRGSQAVDAAIKVHTALGPGLLEGAYEACLAYELRSRGLSVQRQGRFLFH